MKNKLFLVALATVTVLGPSLATPHHQTVRATEYCTYVTGKPGVGVCYKRKDGMPIEENIITKNNDFSLLNWFWEIVTNWWSKITGYFS
ncbi:TPA: SpoV family signaling peptide [Streptococcus pyogenes]